MFQPQVMFGLKEMHVDDPVKQAIMPIPESIFVSFLPAFNEVGHNNIQINNEDSRLEFNSYLRSAQRKYIETTDITSD